MGALSLDLKPPLRLELKGGVFEAPPCKRKGLPRLGGIRTARTGSDVGRKCLGGMNTISKFFP